VDLKYLTSTQTVEVAYEGFSRRFTVDSISPTSAAGQDLVVSLEALSFNSSSQLWTVGWDTSVSILANETKREFVDHKVIKFKSNRSHDDFTRGC
jgi:AAA family ATPase